MVPGQKLIIKLILTLMEDIPEQFFCAISYLHKLLNYERITLHSLTEGFIQ